LTLTSPRRLIRLLPLFLLFLAAPARAQSSLEVTVFDSAGQPAAGAALSLANEAIGYSAEATTNGQGKARFLSLATAGLYEVAAKSADGAAEAVAGEISLRGNQEAGLILTLRPLAAFGQEIAVDGGAVFVNTVNAEVAATLTAAEIEVLPVEGRDLTRALYRLPNVTQATGFYPEAPNVSVNGANSLFTSYLLDGFDNTENFLGGQKFAVPTGFVQDVTVLTATFTAEFGRTANGIVDATTRSGGNGIAGEAFYLTRPGQPLDSESPYPGRDLTGNQVKDGFERHQAGFALNLPLAADRSFLFADAEYTADAKDNLLASPRLGVAATVPGDNRFLFLSARLDHRFSESLSAWGRLNWGDVEVESQGGGLAGGVTFPSAGSAQDRNSVLAAFKASKVGADLVGESGLQFSRFRWNYGRPLSGPGPQVVVQGEDGATLAVLGHPGFVFDDLEETWQLQQKFFLRRGDHTLKFGAELLHSDFALDGGGNVDGNYLVQLTAAQEASLRAGGFGASLDPSDLPANVRVLDYAVELRPASFGKAQEQAGIYAEDLYSLSSRLNLSLGLRWDYDNLSQGGGDGADLDNFAPRVGLNWQVDDKSVLRGGFGIFYDKVLYAVYSDALQQNSTAAGFRAQLQELIALGILPADTDLGRVLFDGNLTANFGNNVPYLQGPGSAALQGRRETIFSNERRILNPEGYDNPRSAQFSLGYQRQLRGDLLLSVDLIHSESENLFRLRDLNAPAPYPIDPGNVVLRTPEEADASRPVAPRPGGARSIVVSETEGSAHYKAATVTLQKSRSALPFSWRLAYTWSRLRNDTDDINFRAQDSNDFGAEWGPSVNDREHVAGGYAEWAPLPAFQVSLAMLAQSGQPINRIPDGRIYGTTDLNGDGRSFGDAYVGNSDRQPGESRNSDRLPWSYVFDLGAAWHCELAGRPLVFRMDVFNLFDRENLSGYANNATQSNQIQSGPAHGGPAGSPIVRRNAGPPRQFQFGITWRF
jgi:hypothetical protein